MSNRQSDNDEQELDQFKSRVNLSEFAAAHGYVLVRKSSSRSSVVMAHPDGDKVVIAVAPDGHWVYFSVRQEQDSGTIIDFAQRRVGGSLGQVRRLLRQWLGGDVHTGAGCSSSLPSRLRPRPADGSFAMGLEPVARDIAAVRARFAAMALIDPENAYLTLERCIPPHVLVHPRFHSAIRSDDRGNVVFPHTDGEGVCGYEIKGSAFTGFAAGGTKALWRSVGDAPDDQWLVLTESAIDALSYAALWGMRRSRFASIAGQMSAHQNLILRSAVELFPSGGQVVLAFDNDDAGDALTHRVAQLISLAGRTDLRFVDDRPMQRGSDWNDVLRRRAPVLKPRPSVAPLIR